MPLDDAAPSCARDTASSNTAAGHQLGELTRYFGLRSLEPLEHKGVVLSTALLLAIRFKKELRLVAAAPCHIGITWLQGT